MSNVLKLKFPAVLAASIVGPISETVERRKVKYKKAGESGDERPQERASWRLQPNFVDLQVNHKISFNAGSESRGYGGYWRRGRYC